MNLQHLRCWNHLEKLAEMFVNTFHREHILLILKIKKLLRKIKSKNLTAGFFLILVQPRKTRPFITERLLMGRKESNQAKSKQTIYANLWI